MSSSEHHDLIVAYRQSGDPWYLLQFYTHQHYTDTYQGQPKYKWVRKYQILADMVAAKPGKVLDVGCATRALVEPMFSPNNEYNGLDINAAFGPEYVGDAHRLAEIVPNDFEWLILSDVLEHVHDPAEVLRQAAMVCRKILVVVPQMYHLEAVPLFDRFRNPRDRHIHVGGIRTWCRIFAAAELRPTSLRGFYYIPSLSPNIKNRRLRNLETALDSSKVLRRLDRAVFERLASLPIIRSLGQEAIFVLVKDR